jgi:hypothetical protein
VWSEDPESCAGSSFATGRVSHAGVVEGDDTDQERHPQPQGVVWLAFIHADGVNGT